jgi:hypothetical protein
MSEQLNHSSPKLFLIFSLSGKAALFQNYVANSFCEGLTSCIPKRGKEPSVCSSYRPITVCLILGKLLENFLEKFFIV